MTLISAWVMLLATMRDRAALIMAFVLPPLLFIVFASIFSGASGKDLKLKLGLLDAAHAPTALRLVEALRQERTIRLIELPSGDARDMAALVERGAADVGIVIRGALDQKPDQGPPPVVIVESPARPLASLIGIGALQRALSEKLPDVALARILTDVEASGAIGKEDRDALTSAIRDETASRTGVGVRISPLFERLTAESGGGVRNGNVLYYAGAVTAIFLLFGAVHGGLTLVDERRGGIADRLMISRANFAALVLGKFLFLVAQGAVQAAIVYATAYLIYDASVPLSSLGVWFVACVLASSASAALALLLCALCRSRKQAEGFTTFSVLLLSAAGGSMVPRYLMPAWLQELSWLTPNAWIIDAFDRSVLPGIRLADLATSFGVLALVTVVAGGLAAWLATLRPGQQA